MSKNAIIGIIVLCFVSTFMTMVYQYASRGYLHESNPPIGGSGHHAAASHEGGHETPGPAVETPMSVETPAATEAPVATETPAAVETPAVETPSVPTTPDFPVATPAETPATPVATPVP